MLHDAQRPHYYVSALSFSCVYAALDFFFKFPYQPASEVRNGRVGTYIKPAMLASKRAVVPWFGVLNAFPLWMIVVASSSFPVSGGLEQLARTDTGCIWLSSRPGRLSDRHGWLTMSESSQWVCFHGPVSGCRLRGVIHRYYDIDSDSDNVVKYTAPVNFCLEHGHCP